MADKQVIIAALERIMRRVRANGLVRDLSFGFAISLLFPLFFKIWDMFSPLAANSVIVVMSIWLIGLAGFVLWNLTRKDSMLSVAADIDRRAGLRDELRSAYWFIQSGRTSPWIEMQVERAARTASKLKLDSMYPLSIPRSSFGAAALLTLLLILNFAPLPFAHNWLYSQNPPAFALTDQQRELAEQIQEILGRPELQEDTQLAERIQEILEQLQEGSLSPEEALARLKELQDQLDEGNLEVGAMNEGLEEIAQDLKQSQPTEKVAEDMLSKDLKKAAEDLRKLAEEMGMSTDPGKLEEVQMSLEQASENNRPGLEQLTQQMKQGAESLSKQDQKGAQQSMEQAANELEKLAQKMDSQQLKNQASEKLQDLEQSLAQQQAQQQQQQGQTREQQSGQGGEETQGKGQQQKEGSSQGQQGQEAQTAGQAGGEPQPGEEGGKGQMPSGAGGGNPQQTAEATSLEVQLKQEKLTGQIGDEKDEKEGKPEMTEELSKAERSKLDYRNVRSELSSAQQDVLNQDRIPWEYRNLIRDYFQAIRPREKK